MALKKYELAIRWIEQKIAEDHMTAGDRLPGEVEMAKRLGISRQTVRQAVGILEQRGILRSVQGSGIYVASRGEIAPPVREHFGKVTILSTYLDDYIFPATVRGMQNVLAQNGYSSQILITDNRIQSEREILERILEEDETDGIIAEAVKSSLPNPNLEYYRQLAAKGVKIVFFNSFYPELAFPCVRIDDAKCAKDAVNLFLAAGLKRIAGIFKSDDGQGHLRYQGYIEALVEAQTEICEERILWLDSAVYRNLETGADGICARLGDADAVLCYNDEAAAYVIEALLRRGKRVPEDVAVAGIDDSYLAQLCTVPITSFAHPKGKLGEAAAGMLVGMIENNSRGEDLIMEAPAVIRASTAAGI